MKKLLIIIVLSFLAKFSSAQSWAPIGAKWYYGEGFAFSGNIDYVLYTSEKDTTVKGQNCRKIIKNHDFVCYSRPKFELMYSNSDTVFFYDNKFDSFQMLYRFNAVKNDSWYILAEKYQNLIDTIMVRVDSTSSMLVNNQSLKVQYVSYINLKSPTYAHKSTIIEKIGDPAYMFDYYIQYTGFCDINYPRGLRCYEDTIIGNYHFANMDSCMHTYIWPIGLKPISEEDIILYPNPTNETIYITGLNHTAYFQMYDINGRLVKSGNTKDAQIQVKDLVSGIYMLRIFDEKANEILNKSIVKN